MVDYYKKYLKYKAKYIHLQNELKGGVNECIYESNSCNLNKYNKDYKDYIKYGNCEMIKGVCSFHQKCKNSTSEDVCNQNIGDKICKWDSNSNRCYNPNKKSIFCFKLCCGKTDDGKPCTCKEFIPKSIIVYNISQETDICKNCHHKKEVHNKKSNSQKKI
jgi:hypothetical protein